MKSRVQKPYDSSKNRFFGVALRGASAAAAVILFPCLVLLGLKITLGVGAVMAAVVAFTVRNRENTALSRQKTVTILKKRLPSSLPVLLLLAVSCRFFFLNMIHNANLLRLAGVLGIESGHLLFAGTAALVVLAVPFVLDAHAAMGDCWRSIAEKASSNRISFGLLRAFVVFLVMTGLYYLLEITSSGLKIGLFHGGAGTFFCNILVLLFAELVFAILLGNTERSLTLLSVLVALWSVANYYTVQYHGSPLIVSEFLNTKTAMAVAGSYRYDVSLVIVVVVFVAAAVLWLVWANRPVLVRRCGRLKSAASLLTVLIAAGAILWKLYPSVTAVNGVWMPWQRQINENGFLVYSLWDLRRRSVSITKPDGYDSAVLPEGTNAKADPENGEYPDIILILNESFCDLSSFADLDTDVDALEAFYSIPCVAGGSAVIPYIGGGTSDSEFELLMSKSEYLLAQGAPFTWLRNEQLGRSVVTYLRQFGYETTGMHILPANYNRNNAYPAMGFDHVFLGVEQPNSESSSYGNRKYTDEAFFEDLKRNYALIDPSKPQLFYLLTYQNHGGYEQNDASEDTVHVLNDLGDLTDDVSEYLSSVKLSADSFKALTEYYAAQDRKTIICMVGDHAPPFIRSLPAKDPGMDEREKQVVQRTVPYIIWANFDTEPITAATEYVSMVDLVPMVLSAAGMPLSPFYSHILSMHDVLPVRIRNGYVADREGNIMIYPDETGEWNGMLNAYYYLEYHSLQADEEYREELFAPFGETVQDKTENREGYRSPSPKYSLA